MSYDHWKTKNPEDEKLGPETTDREICDRAEISIQRAINCGWITFNSSTGREQFHATLRIALDMEVEAGGPYLVDTE